MRSYALAGCRALGGAAKHGLPGKVRMVIEKLSGTYKLRVDPQ
jgi:hypothetical protein